jgi:cbb3-type cytochrome oxidase subunit 3
MDDPEEGATTTALNSPLLCEAVPLAAPPGILREENFQSMCDTTAQNKNVHKKSAAVEKTCLMICSFALGLCAGWCSQTLALSLALFFTSQCWIGMPFVLKTALIFVLISTIYTVFLKSAMGLSFPVRFVRASASKNSSSSNNTAQGVQVMELPFLFGSVISVIAVWKLMDWMMLDLRESALTWLLCMFSMSFFAILTWMAWTSKKEDAEGERGEQSEQKYVFAKAPFKSRD